MANKMLIDAAHPEETRVVVVRGNRVEEFDFEAANRKQLRGNIYLAKVTRVEPSLQAAFVEYGGNRHGFLAFSEIHPDYYQIPVADRQALLDNEEPEDDGADNGEAVAAETKKPKAKKSEDSEADAEAKDADADGDDDGDADGEDQVESVGAEDAMEEVPERRQQRRQYKIQEVIKRRQVLLVQVVKEERGNKGAALTTYLSLAGRYSVLMPNTGRGGGISRKITQPTDRKRLKKIASELDVPEGMGVILRTAGASRTKAEIKRDFEYLMRLWETVRELTLKSSAPCLVYEEGSLIKRSIRDLYNKDIDEVLVAGDEGYREAKDFMRMLMPSHAKNVQPYRDASPIFIRYGVEPQLDAMFSPQVTLKSGGYIVINQTEALVSVDVNSGKSTREHNIEDTALQTNLEAAEEVTRQLRLRDLAGLVVIDFIDMEENKNNRTVERRLKECLKSDRARIQVGRISHFGLLEMSRQRIRTGVLESSTSVCPHCHGTGMIRSVESVALHVLRSLEDHLLKGVTHNLVVRTTTSVALYILNQKRRNLADLEARFGVEVVVQADEMVNGQHYVLERSDPVDRDKLPPQPQIVQPDTIDLEIAAEPEEVEEKPAEENDRKRRRRRRRRKGSSEAAAGDSQETTEGESTEEAEDESKASENDDEAQGDGEPRRKRRRGRRGGRRGRRGADGAEGAEIAEAGADAVSDEGTEAEGNNGVQPANVEAGDQPEVTDTPAAEAAPAETSSEAGASEVTRGTGLEVEATSEAETTETAAAAEAGTAETSSADVSESGSSETAHSEDTSAEVVETVSAEPEKAEENTPVEEEHAVAQETKSAPEEADAAPAEEPEAASAPKAPKEPVVTSELASSSESDAEEEAPKPKRGGWWQRRSFF